MLKPYQTLNECPSCKKRVKKLAKHMKHWHPKKFERMSFHNKKDAMHPKEVEFRESAAKQLIEVKT